MRWYVIDKEYIKYLQRFDKFFPNVEYKNRMKCFLGIILSVNGMDYFAPLTSYKSKFDYMKNGIDFFKLRDKEKNKIYGAININNMIPVMKDNYTEITFDNLNKFRVFNNNREKKYYWKLLNKEALLLDEDLIINNAKELYCLKKYNTNHNISKKCCNFFLLEEKCFEYNKMHIKEYI